ncbi:MAG TPA: GNAT family N-acetyltransferase [Blastococcus sp.]|nr:GNAT family N-acetyltransferase [Blastococcus sp.]
MVPSNAASSLVVEPARPVDHPRIAELTVRTYVDGGLAPDEYVPRLADVAGRAAQSELLVARAGDRIVGSVALVLSGEFGEVTTSEDEAAFRMLVVDASVRGMGIGELLVLECLDRARAAGKRRMVLSTDPRMTAAHRLYERLGFTRLPERDWSPLPGIDLLVYAREL